MITGRKKNRTAAALMSAIMILAVIFAGCSGQSGAELKVSEDLESMRYVELDPEINAELEGLLSDQGREYYEMIHDFFYGKKLSDLLGSRDPVYYI